MSGARRGPRVTATALVLGACMALSGCSQDRDGRSPRPPAAPSSTAGTPRAVPAPPATAEEFLARARKAMNGEKGWTFAVRGREGLVLQGRENAATYTATVRRTTGERWALHSTGTTTSSKGVAEAEEIYVVDGTVHVRRGGPGAAWTRGPLTDPEQADRVEDPVAALDAFEEYGPGDVTPARVDGRVELRVRTGPGALSAARGRGVVEKAVRELRPTLRQLRAAGVAAPESAITVEYADETLVLDPATHRITSHTFRCAFRIPHGERTIRYEQQVTERTEGTYGADVTLPSQAR
ncbi:hypothetical protein ACFYOV_12980 [Streptomyces sp. NPDC005931]|uniref:hypothetical protein n=1 Tax=Streptomyces sp. NPDC005931 TaxID=3364737 RepID=UPI00367F5825